MSLKRILHILFIGISCYLLLLTPPSGTNAILLIGLSAALLFEPYTLIPLLFVTSISSSIAVIPGISGYYYYTYLFLLGCFIKYPFRLELKHNVITIILYIACLTISALCSVSQDMSPAIKMIIAIAPLIIIASFQFIDNNQELLYYTYIGAIIVSTIITLKLILDPVLYIPNEEILSYYTDLEEVQITFAKEINPNTTAQSLLLAFVIIFIYAINSTKRKILLFALTIIPSIPILLIGSRTVFIALISIATIFFLWKAQIKRSTKILIALTCLIAAGFVMDWIVSINDRFILEDISEDRGSGRFDTWEHLFNNVIPYNLMLGVGYGRINLTWLGYDVDADNMYVDALSQIGVCGLMSLLLMLTSMTKPLLRNNTRMVVNQIALAMMIFIIIVGFGETIFDTYIFVFIIFFTLIAIQRSNMQIR